MPKIQNRGVILALLTLVYTFNFIDRQIVGTLGPFIKADLGLDDTQLGLLTGIVFAAFYTAIGIPIASLVDNTKTLRLGPISIRFDRVTIIALSLATWSFFTVLTGFVGGFAIMALLRIGVAIGEAGCSPPSHALISDLYPPKERAKALSIFALGVPFGTMAAYFAVAFFANGGSVDWRAAFIVVGLAGLPIAFAVKALLPEPERGRLDAGASQALPFKQAVGTLAKIPSYWAMALGIAFTSFGGYAVAGFLTTYIFSAYPGIPVVPVLIGLGVGNATFYAAGTFLGGLVADKYGAKNVAAYAIVPAVTVALAGVALTVGWHIGTFAAFAVCLSLFVFFNGFNLGPSFSVAQNLAGVSVRATSTAVFFFVLNIIALGLGPTVTGILSDMFAAQTGDTVVGLRYALTALAVPFTLSVGAYLFAARSLPRDWAKANG
ncbi:MAG: MFS transporter [Pseudomonadota bacterium]